MCLVLIITSRLETAFLEKIKWKDRVIYNVGFLAIDLASHSRLGCHIPVEN